MDFDSRLDRRAALLGGCAVSLSAVVPLEAARAVQLPRGRVVSVEDFGARAGSGRDDTQAIQMAIDTVQRSGGGTVLVPGRYRCGNIVISGANVRIQGRSGWLQDGRLTVKPTASNVEVADLGIVSTTGQASAYLLDVSGRNCRFTNLELVKDPIAGGYQGYIRQVSSGCSFDGLRLRGSNGLLVAGTDHVFENFDLQSTMTAGVGGDDAFAIKALEGLTQNITIRNGLVRGYSAIVSFGSEIGARAGFAGAPGAVRNVTVENVRAELCTSLVFFKPGALIYEWRNGVVEHVKLANLTLDDPTGRYFQSGIRIYAARGAIVRDVQATGIRINARAKTRGVVPTAALDMTLFDVGAPARIDDVRVQLAFIDPYAGAPHSAAAPGFPINHVVEIEKRNPAKGSMSGIVLDVEGTGSSFGGVYVGAGLDRAVQLQRAVLRRVATDPPATLGGGGIWSDSSIGLGDVSVDSVRLPKFAGRAFQKPR